MKRKFKNNYKYLKDKIIKLQTQNNILKSFTKPTNKDKMDAIENYFLWCAKRDFEIDRVESFCLYKEEMKKEWKYE